VTDPTDLSTAERAFAVAAVRALGARAETVCARRSPALKRYAQLLARESALLEAEAASLDAPIPTGLSEIHPSWYIAPPQSSVAAARAWVERLAYGHLVEMRSDRAAAGVLDKLPRRDSATLEGLLLALGRRRVAIAFSGAPRAALARLCARLGEPAASELLVEVRGLRAQLSPDEVREAQRALFGFGGDGDPAGLFERAGCGLLGPALRARGGDLLRRVAQRLPRAIGEALSEAARASADAQGDVAAAVALLLPRAV
jgi:hypothetical protein